MVKSIIAPSVRGIQVRISNFNAVFSGGIKVFNNAGITGEKIYFHTEFGNGRIDPLDVPVQLGNTSNVGKTIFIDFNVAPVTTGTYFVTIEIIANDIILANSSTILSGTGGYDYIAYKLL